MPLAHKTTLMKHTTQAGASLIEVLVAILILSFGLLSLGAMLSFSIQMPKLAGYRTSAIILATSHIERIRANPDGFAQANNTGGFYAAALNETLGWSFNAISAVTTCSFTGTQCTAQTLAQQDTNDLRVAVRRELPAGDVMITCSDNPCLKTSFGEIWILWQEPTTYALLNTTSDNCPAAATTLYTNPSPRCLHMRFKIQ